MDRAPVHGFSLVELLTALAIVAILATVTIPSFSGVVAKSRRSDAVSALLQLQLAQERWRAEHLSYALDLSVLGYISSASPDGYYRLRVTQADAAGFIAIAEPVGAQRGDRCGAFAVDGNGPRYGEGFADTGCWRR
jgi:type IV pilus assembly protein PilE